MFFYDISAQVKGLLGSLQHRTYTHSLRRLPILTAYNITAGIFHSLCVSDGNTRTRLRKGSTVIISNYPSTPSTLGVLTHFLYFHLHSSLFPSHSVSLCCCHCRLHIYTYSIFLPPYICPTSLLSLFYFLYQTPTHRYILYFLLFTITFSCSAYFSTLCHTLYSFLLFRFHMYPYSSLFVPLCIYSISANLLHQA